MILLAVDPGLHGCGAALFKSKKLIRAAYVSSDKEGNILEIAQATATAVCLWMSNVYPRQIALEWPQIYASLLRAGKTKADPNDLLALAAVDSALADKLAADSFLYTPAEWKGQMTKEVCQARIESRLDVHEFGIAAAAVKMAKSKGHNVFDAVGIGLHHLGRFERKRAI